MLVPLLVGALLDFSRRLPVPSSNRLDALGLWAALEPGAGDCTLLVLLSPAYVVPFCWLDAFLDGRWDVGEVVVCCDVAAAAARPRLSRTVCTRDRDE